MVRDWSNHKYGLNGALLNPPVKYGDMDGFLQLLSPGDCMGGVGSQDGFLHWLVAPPRRCFLGVRHPVSGRLGVYLFLPFGLSQSPGRNDCCVRKVLGVSPVRLPRLKIIDVAED